LFSGDQREYLSSYSIDKSKMVEWNALEVVTSEFLNSLRTFGLPNHKIKLKVGTPIMLLRNMYQSQGLCNGTRLVVTRLANHVIEARVMSKKQNGSMICIPIMYVSFSITMAIKLIRRQFLIILICYDN